MMLPFHGGDGVSRFTFVRAITYATIWLQSGDTGMVCAMQQERWGATLGAPAGNPALERSLRLS
jgi:hypothetical protein